MRPALPATVATAAAQTVIPAVPVNCGPLPDEAPDQLPTLRSSVGLNCTNDMLDLPGEGAVEVCVLVDSTGTVRAAELTQPAGSFAAALLDAARWWVFAPARRGGRPVPARIGVRIEARVPQDAGPLVPDVVAMALAAEERGNPREAIDAWTGALARAGTHPAIQNEWSLRAHILRLAASLETPLVVPTSALSSARATHNLMLRNIARGPNEDYALALDKVLNAAPWYGDAYRWRASARASSGQRDGAVRDVLCYRLAAPDSAGRALAERALVALAKADTVAALTLLR